MVVDILPGSQCTCSQAWINQHFTLSPLIILVLILVEPLLAPPLSSLTFCFSTPPDSVGARLTLLMFLCYFWLLGLSPLKGCERFHYQHVGSFLCLQSQALIVGCSGSRFWSMDDPHLNQVPVCLRSMNQLYMLYIHSFLSVDTFSTLACKTATLAACKQL